MDHDPARVVLQSALLSARQHDAPLLLAVSGGLDSTALLLAMEEVTRPQIAAVATFDHGTGPAATAAAAMVARLAARVGLPVVTGAMPADLPVRDGREASWRRARHAFLARYAAALGAHIVTAHTEDDQVETVLMRVMRHAGARGLAGLAAPSAILRPFLTVRRATLRAYLVDRGAEWAEDPSNASREFLRNRVRHDLLPALRRVDPSIDDTLLATGRAAAGWRVALESVIDHAVHPVRDDAGGVRVASAELTGYDRDSLAMLWSAIAGRAGLALDRRGTVRLAAFMMKEPGSGSMPLSGGWCLEAQPGAYLLRRAGDRPAAPATLPEVGTVEWGRFRFRVSGFDDPAGADGSWSATLPVGARVQVRAWIAGDRLASSGGQLRRRVTRYLSDAGVRGSERASWPVVVVAGERNEGDVIWIPGVRRSDAATERSGRPVRHYVCERIAP